MLELGDRAEDLKEHPADRGRRVDALVEHDEVHLLGLQLLGQRHQVLERAPEAIELRDDELVALTRVVAPGQPAPHDAARTQRRQDGKAESKSRVGSDRLMSCRERQRISLP